MIRFQCPACKSVLETAGDKSHGQVPCPKCGQLLQLPRMQPSARVAPMIRFACPSCGKHLKAPEDASGRKPKCPRCGRRFVIPPLASTEPPPPANPGAFEFDNSREPVVGTKEESTATTAQRKRGSSLLPTVISILAFLSVFWLCLSVGSARDRPWNGSPATLESYEYRVRQEERLDRELAKWGTNHSTVYGGCCGCSMFLSLGLTITSFCFWKRHNLAGRILSIAAAVLLIPCTCCGWLT